MINENTSRLIDFHCHIDLYEDFNRILEDCVRYKVTTLAVTTTPKAWPRNKELLHSCELIRLGLGLHPQLVEERYQEIERFEKYLTDSPYVGEVGLDAGPRYIRSLELQKSIFTRILQGCSSLGGKILSVHSTRAVTKVLDLLEEHMPPGRGTVVLHWFSGSKSELRRAIDLGCYFSINQKMLVPGPRLELLKVMPIDRLLTETDGPFIRVGDAPIYPSSISKTIVCLGRVLGRSSSEMENILLSNLRSIDSKKNPTLQTS